MIINCHEEANLLIHRPLPKVPLKEGLEIADKLYQELDKLNGSGIGLAANQIGIDAAVAVINVIEPRTLINPIIKEQWGDKILFNEGCLSYPGLYIDTLRYKSIVIHTEQEEADWYFSGQNEQLLLEAVAIQHEIDHLNGTTILDRKRKPVKIDLLPGRNDPCACGSQKKFKKCCL